MYYYNSAKDDQEVVDKLQYLAERYPTSGIETFYGKIRMEGLRWNRKRVLRLYRMLNLKMRRKRKRRLPARVKESLVVPTFLNETWSIMHMLICPRRTGRFIDKVRCFMIELKKNIYIYSLSEKWEGFKSGTATNGEVYRLFSIIRFFRNQNFGFFAKRVLATA